jgi:ribonucleoside-diphosphate reductase alpha chain
VSNLFKRETLSGEFLQINRYLVNELQERGLWTEEIAQRIKRAGGSIQEIEEIPADLRQVYRTAWELPQRSLIDLAASRGAYIDQSQSLNLFMESPSIGKLSSMYMHAWKSGLKTTYYLRSRPATRINQTTTGPEGADPTHPTNGGIAEPSPFTDEEAIACSSVNGDGSTAVPLGGSVGPDPSVPEVVWLIRVAGLDRK